MATNDRTRWSLRGPVRTCRIERTWYASRCGPDACDLDERGDVAVVEFVPSGAMAAHRHRNHDGSEWTVKYDYEPAGHLIAAISQDSSGSTARVYEYDDDARLRRVVVRKATEERASCASQTPELGPALLCQIR